MKYSLLYSLCSERMDKQKAKRVSVIMSLQTNGYSLGVMCNIPLPQGKSQLKPISQVITAT